MLSTSFCSVLIKVILYIGLMFLTVQSSAAAVVGSQSNGVRSEQLPTVSPPDWPLNVSWPETITCADIKLELGTYKAQLKNAKRVGHFRVQYDGVITHDTTWQLVQKVLHGTQTYQIHIIFKATAGALVYDPKASYEVLDKNGHLVKARDVRYSDRHESSTNLIVLQSVMRFPSLIITSTDVSNRNTALS